MVVCCELVAWRWESAPGHPAVFPPRYLGYTERNASHERSGMHLANKDKAILTNFSMSGSIQLASKLRP